MNPLGYDARGNITSDGSYSYAYSSENLLTSLTNPAGTVQTASTYAYDPLLRLSAIDSGNSGFDVQFGYDGQEIIYEGLSSNRTRRYVFGPAVDEPLVAYLVTSTGTSRSWYLADERGSTIRQTQDSGSPGGAIGRYDEYGVGPGTSRFQYTGQYWLGDSNLHYYRARIYDAKLGRFLQPDPIGYGGGMNMYAYVGGDPVNLGDPSGTSCTGTRIESNCGEKGIAKSLSSGTLLSSGGGSGGLSGGSSICINCGQKAKEGPNGAIVVTAPTYQWISWSTGSIPNFATPSNELAGQSTVSEGEQYAAQPTKPPCFSINQRREHHDRWVAREAARLRTAGYQVATEVSMRVWTPRGSVMARADIVARIPGSRYYLINEVKTGDARFSSNQSIVYSANLAVIVGARGLSIGLKPGDYVPLNTFTSTRCRGLG